MDLSNLQRILKNAIVQTWKTPPEGGVSRKRPSSGSIVFTEAHSRNLHPSGAMPVMAVVAIHEPDDE